MIDVPLVIGGACWLYVIMDSFSALEEVAMSTLVVPREGQARVLTISPTQDAGDSPSDRNSSFPLTTTPLAFHPNSVRMLVGQ
jgi:hypothetical protein